MSENRMSTKTLPAVSLSVFLPLAHESIKTSFEMSESKMSESKMGANNIRGR